MLTKFREKLNIWFAWHLPKEVVYYAALRLAVRATQGEYSETIVPNLTAADALRRWRDT